ncbi:hypothetical protein [Sphingobacterium spiritivorum]|uniref:hypothetical protein n=1 Tax=Sphingobacterium spiritivorum TaxID=258 RepID=UPI003DA3AC96
MKKQPKYSDFLEQSVADCLKELDIKFIHESQNNGSNLDFYLPDFDVYIEVKQFHTERIGNQLSTKDNVIVFQGKKTIQFLKLLVKKNEKTT